MFADLNVDLWRHGMFWWRKRLVIDGFSVACVGVYLLCGEHKGLSAEESAGGVGTYSLSTAIVEPLFGGCMSEAVPMLPKDIGHRF